MGKTLTCPYCNYGTTLNVVYSYRGHNKRKETIDVNNLLKDGTIYRGKKPRFNKYDFDGSKITAKHYNKYCPNCHRYFHSIGNMAVVDIVKIELIYFVNNNRHRYDFIIDKNKSSYTYKKNYVLSKEDALSEQEKYNILSSVKEAKMNFWYKEYIGEEPSKFNWIVKMEYYNGLSICYYGYGKVSNKWNTFISGFKPVIKKCDISNDVDLMI